MERLSAMNREELTQLVRYHIVPSRVAGAQLRDNVRLTTLSATSTDKPLLVKRYRSVYCLSLPLPLSLSLSLSLLVVLFYRFYHTLFPVLVS